MGIAGGTEVGVDFEEETVDEEIVIALPEEGGMNCFVVGVGGAAAVVVVVLEVAGFEERDFVSDGGSGCCGGGLVTITSSWTGFSISSTWARFLGIIAAGGVVCLLSIM